MCEPKIVNAWQDIRSIDDNGIVDFINKPIYNCDSCDNSNCASYCEHHECSECDNYHCMYHKDFDQQNEDYFANRR